MHAKQLALLLALAMTTGPAAQSRVMPLGDSITEAETPHASYRYFLWKELESWQGQSIASTTAELGADSTGGSHFVSLMRRALRM
jgi:hypothetical protein